MDIYLLGFLGGRLILLGASVRAWYRGREMLAVALLAGAALLLRLLMASLDPFLHDWDERFHAVVARNLVAHPLRPMLRAEPLLPYDYQAWCCNHIWLHKQPLFLWQMALSMKAFGINTLAMRLPSILLSTLLIWPVYRLGYLVFDSRLTGYLGAVLVAFAYYQLELVSGALGMDHNDVAFLVYVTASIWAYYEYRVSPHPWRWLVLTGLLAGAAVLCKWLTGLLVYAAWGLDLLLHLRRRHVALAVSHLLASLAVAVVVLLPWQLFTAWRYPRESAYERAYNLRHFTEVLEGHAHPWYYHFELLPTHYGWLLGLVVIGIVMALRGKTARNTWPLLAIVALVYLFFTLAATKMYSYAYVVSPILLLVAAKALAEFVQVIRQRLARQPMLATAAAGAALSIAILLDLRPWGIAAYHFQEQSYGELNGPLNRRIREDNALVYKRLEQEIPAGYAVFNVPYGDELDAMFFSGRSVYAGIPSQDEIRSLQARGISLAAYPARPAQSVPSYLKQPSVVQLWGLLQDN